ncbi:phosphatase PAP2 family protein [Candidatus Woesearchaeota archaeon]|nr:phosphatase PAP2 family protein [Candidatus Woesearchaeota archaeon]
MKKKVLLSILVSILFVILLFTVIIPNDHTLINAVVSHRIPQFNWFFHTLSYIGDFHIVFILLAVFFLITKQKKNIPLLAIQLVVSGIIAYLLKIVVARPRPDVLVLGNHPITPSFPSGHATAVFTVLPLIWKLYPKFKWVWLVIAMLVGYSRMYLGVHYGSDVLAGMFLGLTIGLLLLKLEQSTRWIEKHLPRRLK